MRGLAIYLAADAHRHRSEAHHHSPPRTSGHRQHGLRAQRLAGWIVGTSGVVLGGLAVLVALPTPPGA